MFLLPSHPLVKSETVAQGLGTGVPTLRGGKGGGREEGLGGCKICKEKRGEEKRESVLGTPGSPSKETEGGEEAARNEFPRTEEKLEGFPS